MKRLGKVFGGVMCAIILTVILLVGRVRTEDAEETIVIQKMAAEAMETADWIKPQERGEISSIFIEGMDMYESNIWMEEVEKQRNEKNRTMIWGIVVMLLVAAMFAVGMDIVNWEKKRENKTGENPEVEKKSAQ